MNLSNNFSFKRKILEAKVIISNWSLHPTQDTTNWIIITRNNYHNEGHPHWEKSLETEQTYVKVKYENTEENKTNKKEFSTLDSEDHLKKQFALQRAIRREF